MPTRVQLKKESPTAVSGKNAFNAIQGDFSDNSIPTSDGNVNAKFSERNGQHRSAAVVMPDGSAFELTQRANAVPTTVGGVTKDAKSSGEVAPTINTASNDSISVSSKKASLKSRSRNGTTHLLR